jgi:hypothetical protein
MAEDFPVSRSHSINYHVPVVGVYDTLTEVSREARARRVSGAMVVEVHRPVPYLGIHKAGFVLQGFEDADGGAAGAGGTAGAASAPAAVQAGGQQFAGAGTRFQIAAGGTQDALPPRASSGEFLGLNQLADESEVADGYVPFAVNWDDFNEMGAYCVRRGVGKLDMDINTVVDGSSNPLPQGSGGLQVVAVAAADFLASSDFMVIKRDTGDTVAFWFDTTGADTVPAGAAAANDTVRVDISGVTTAEEVATVLDTAIQGTLLRDATLVSAPTAARIYAMPAGWSSVSAVADAGFQVLGYRGLSISRIPGETGRPDQLLLAFSEQGVEIGEQAVQSPTTLHVVTAMPTMARLQKFEGHRGPWLQLSQIAGPQLRVVSSFTPTILGATRDRLVKSSIRQLVVRYSSVAYPSDPDGKDETQSTALVDRRGWSGGAVTDDTNVSGGLPTGRLYVTAWAGTLEGFTEPSRATIIIT